MSPRTPTLENLQANLRKTKATLASTTRRGFQDQKTTNLLYKIRNTEHNIMVARVARNQTRKNNTYQNITAGPTITPIPKYGLIIGLTAVGAVGSAVGLYFLSTKGMENTN